MHLHQTAAPRPRAALHDDPDLQVRIRAEFRELPGMKLTLAQAARLFHAEPTRCEQALGGLVAEGELTSDGRTFARHGSAFPRA